jgi:Fur family peroxide stress response transcriptional regulator
MVAGARRGAREVAGRCAEFARLCRARGVRVTAQRLAVYRALAEDAAHPTADEVHRRLRATMPSLSPATVYRVLETLVREGVLRRVSTTGGAGRFDANLDPHQHLICRVCGRMTDVFATGLDVGRLAPGIPPGFVVEDVDVRIVGRCGACARGRGRAVPVARAGAAPARARMGGRPGEGGPRPEPA